MSEKIISNKTFVSTKDDKSLIFKIVASGHFSSDDATVRFPIPESAIVFGYISGGSLELMACGTTFRVSGEDAFIVNSAASADLEANLSANTHGCWFACSGTLPEALLEAFFVPTVAIRKANVYDTVTGLKSILEESGNVITEGDHKSLCSLFFDFVSGLSFAEAKAPAIREFSKADEAEMIRTYIDNSIYSDISLDTVKDHFGITKMHAIRVFKAHFDMTPMQYAIKRRADIAASLLATTDLPIKTISEMLHYSNTQHFSNTFKKIVGTSPNRYRANTKKRI